MQKAIEDFGEGDRPTSETIMTPNGSIPMPRSCYTISGQGRLKTCGLIVLLYVLLTETYCHMTVLSGHDHRVPKNEKSAEGAANVT